MDSRYRVLDTLKGTLVNVDELDYLAKRLDGFCAGEANQFEAMAHKLEMSDIKDFINLTFCCQQATVITDFSDLEAVGRTHYLNTHGGCCAADEQCAGDLPDVLQNGSNYHGGPIFAGTLQDAGCLCAVSCTGAALWAEPRA